MEFTAINFKTVFYYISNVIDIGDTGLDTEDI